MDPQIRRLVIAYLKTLANVVGELCESSGCLDPWAAFKTGRIPPRGRLPSDTDYQFHETGCRFHICGYSIEMAFGADGRHDGFDALRLHLFATNFEEYRGLTLQHMDAVLEQLLRAGSIVRPGLLPNPGLCFLTGGIEEIIGLDFAE